MEKLEYNRIKTKVGFALQKYNATQFGVEDVTHDILIMWMRRGNKTGQTVDQAVIDVLRKSTGRKGSTNYESRLCLNTPTEVDENFKKEPISDSYYDIMFEYEKLFHGDFRVCYVLRHKWGFSLEDIAEVLGVTNSLISHRLIKMQKTIQELES